MYTVLLRALPRSRLRRPALIPHNQPACERGGHMLPLRHAYVARLYATTPERQPLLAWFQLAPRDTV